MFLFVAFLGTKTLVAQQDPHFSHYMYNKLAFNPAVAGSEDMVMLNVIHRNQWIGFGEGAPVSTGFNAHTPFKLFGLSSGIGLSLVRDEFAFNGDISAKLNYSYRMDMGEGKLGIGLYGGLINSSFTPKFSKLVDATDEMIPKETKSGMTPDFGVGIFYKSENVFMGLSSTHLTQPDMDYEYVGTKKGYYLKRKYYIVTGYKMSMSNPLFEFFPTVNIESDGVTSLFNLNANIIYNKKIWGGVTYRTGNTFVALLGVELFDGIQFGFAYDYTLSKIQKYSDGSIEVLVRYGFNLRKEKTPQKYKSIRFL